MTEEETYFHEVGAAIDQAEKSQMFGKPCYKIGGKAFVCFYANEMVFKLTGEIHADALSLDGSRLFDPSNKNRPMKEWVQIPFDYQEKWLEFAKQSVAYVKSKLK